jgi:hypothetical protein
VDLLLGMGALCRESEPVVIRITNENMPVQIRTMQYKNLVTEDWIFRKKM